MIVPVPDEVPPVDALTAVHFVGIGGAGLSAIATLMSGRGIRVSGSDAHDSATLESLRGLGIACTVGHDAANVPTVDAVVVSTAVPESNVEVLEARRRQIPVWPRAAAMQSLMAGHRAVVVTGTHGKTTTTGMLVTALLAAGGDPTYTVGSTLIASGTNAALGSDGTFVAEGDESDAAILAYTPFGAVVTNVDVDHLDFYGTEEAYAQAFVAFLSRVDDAGFVICGVDDPGGGTLAEVSRARGLRTVTVGHGPDADVVLTSPDPAVGGGRGPMRVTSESGPLGEVRLVVPGAAYELDAGLALVAGVELGHDASALAAGLASYAGTGRRMEWKGEEHGVRVYDSYAHHPSEIRGDLSAARTLAGPGRVVVCFQPHLFSRTAAFATEMGAALGAADEVLVLDVYPAREQPVEGVTGSLVARAVPLDARRVHEAAGPADAPALLARVAAPGDLVLTLGAGDVTSVGPALLELLRSLARRHDPGPDVHDDAGEADAVGQERQQP